MTTVNQPASPATKSKSWVIIALVGVFGCLCIVVVGVVLGLKFKDQLAIPGLSTAVPTQAPINIPANTPINTPVPPPTDAPIPTIAPTFTAAPTQSISTIVEVLMAAAEGRGVSEAAAYNPKKTGIHPIVIYSADADTVDEWNAELPDTWRAQSVSQAELVAVVIYHEIVIDRARYTAKGMGIFFLNRVRTDTEVILREAQTGLNVSSATFQGGDPPTLKSGYDQIITAVYGTLVSYETVELWLKSFVEK
jgi:hypothetical protein